MADFKKPAPAENTKHAVEIGSIVIFIYLLWVVFERFQQYLIYTNTGSFAELWARFLAYFMAHIMPIILILGIIVVVLTTIGIIYNLKKIKEINEAEREIYGLKDDADIYEETQILNDKWVGVVKNINSINPSDWKLAIIEADIMLDDLLKAAGYHGDSLGEMLKSVEKSDFLTIESAWEAHKVRNQIAHDGESFVLNEREAKRVVALYESVFKEFKII